MKHAFTILLITTLFISCNNQSKEKKNNLSDDVKVLTVDQIQELGAELLEKEVIIKGTVTHVCKNAGARCFLMGSNEDISIRIEAGKIGSFSQDQIGDEIQVRGILFEVQIDEEDLTEMEASSAAGESANKDHALGHDGPEIHDIDGGKHDSINQAEKLNELSQRLAESEDGYVPVYYLEGLELINPK